MAIFVVRWQSRGVVTETVWTEKQEIFTICPLEKISSRAMYATVCVTQLLLVQKEYEIIGNYPTSSIPSISHCKPENVLNGMFVEIPCL